MQVILIEQIEKLGGVGDLVNVKNGFARNYLIPQNKALRATEENRAYYESKKQEILAKNETIKAEAKKIYDKINNKSVIIIRHASEEGRLFGSVVPKDIAEALSKNFASEIKKSQIVLTKAIRVTGIFEIKVRIHAEYLADVKINVARTQEEAKANLKAPKKPEEPKEEKKIEAKEEKKEEPKAAKENSKEAKEASEKKPAAKEEKAEKKEEAKKA